MDLPFDVLERLEESTGRRWSELVLAPAATAKAATAVYRACCEQTGSEPVTLTPRLIASDEVFVTVPDDMPTVFEEGLPKAEAGE